MHILIGGYEVKSYGRIGLSCTNAVIRTARKTLNKKCDVDVPKCEHLTFGDIFHVKTHKVYAYLIRGNDILIKRQFKMSNH